MNIPEPPPATLRLRIDRDALAANWRTLDRLSGTAEAGAAVKAQCYGLGVDQCVPTLLGAGAREFFVAHWSEARNLMRHVAPERISVLHGTGNAAEAAFGIATGIRPVINSLHQARIWREAGGGACHLMVDTGINRLGIALDELGDEAIAALDLDILMSHLSSADEDSPKNGSQLAAFREVAGNRKARRYSLANSAAIALGSDYAFDLTRPGLALYGGIPRSELTGAIRQVAYPQAAVLQVHEIPPGAAIGYNATFTAPQPMRVATVSIGYADGFLRCRGPDTALHKDGRSFPVIGRVSMDMIVVDCGDSTLAEGEFLDIPNDLAEVSQECALSQYELLTTLGDRFSRNS